VVIIQTEALPIRPLCACIWDAAPVEMEVLLQADRLVGGSDAALVIDGTAIPKKGAHSVGVASQYASALGKTASCQTLVSLTLAQGEVPSCWRGGAMTGT
jgi:SRSO17 transposase